MVFLLFEGALRAVLAVLFCVVLLLTVVLLGERVTDLFVTVPCLGERTVVVLFFTVLCLGERTVVVLFDAVRCLGERTVDLSLTVLFAEERLETLLRATLLFDFPLTAPLDRTVLPRLETELFRVCFVLLATAVVLLLEAVRLLRTALLLLLSRTATLLSLRYTDALSLRTLL